MLEDLPNVGKSIAEDLRSLGVQAATGVRHDPCLLDTFISAVRYVEGAPARPWWKYTAERKRMLAARSPRTRKT